MIRLHYSNRMEALLARLAEEIDRDRAESGPWGTVRIVVPNRQVGRGVREHLAARDGIAANLEILFLDGLLKEFLPADARLLDRPRIQGLLLRRLADPAVLAEPDLAPLRRYLAGPDPARRLPQLAFKLAGLFEEYLLSRPGWFPLWEAGGDLEPAGDLERCTRVLWQGVAADLAESDGKWLRPGELPGLLTVPPDAPEGLHLFAMTHLAPVYRPVLDALGRTVPGTRVYALNPCREFWEDLRTDPERRREARRAARRGEGAAGEDPYGLQARSEDEQPLLRRWGRPGREKVHLLNELADWDFEDGFLDPGRDTLLAALQQDLLDRRPPRPVDPSLLADGSLELHACPGPRREAEVLADRIWALVRQGAGSEAPLRFSDIAVLVPSGDLEAAAAHFATAFGSGPGIPSTVLVPGGGALAEVAEAFGLLLDLAESAASRSDLLAFVAHPAVARRFPDLDPEAWARWCDQTGIVRGADRAALEPAYFEGDALSWDQGLRRLALGAFMGAEGGPFVAGGQDYPPRELGSGAWEAAGGFLATVRALLADLGALRSGSRTPKGWAHGFVDLLDRWIGGPERWDQAALARVRSALLRLADLQPERLPPVPLEFRGGAELARQELERLRARSGGARVDGVVVADPEALRGLPFRVVIVAGLGEGRFPGREAADALDLRGRQRLPGDVPAHERDRYLFLEALLSARERLVLSFVDRDGATGEALRPSPLIEELLEAVAAMAGGADLAPLWRRHRLLRWDPERFATHPDLPPAEPSVYLEARTAAWREAGRPGPAPADPADTPFLGPVAATGGPAFRRVGLHDLRTFLESPLQGSARAALHLRDGEDDPALVAEEPSASEALDRTPLRRRAFWAGRGGDLAGAYQRLRAPLERDGRMPLGTLGLPERRQDLEVLEAWNGQVPADKAVDFPRLGGSPRLERGGPPNRVLTPLRLTIGEGAEALEVELTGELQPQADLGQGPGSVVLLPGAYPKGASAAKSVVRAWVDQLVLAALSGQNDPHRVYLVATDKVPDDPVHPCLPALSKEAALATLEAVLLDLLRGRHDHLLPLEAVANLKAVPDPEDFAGWLEGALENVDFTRLSDRYGPVPHPLNYPAALPEAFTARRRLLAPVLTALAGEDREEDA